MPQRLTFLRQWLADPLRVGAVLPSSTSLAHLMTKAIDRNTLVELDERFAYLLLRRFPGARIVQGSAARLSGAGVGRDVAYGAVISELPLLSMPPARYFASSRAWRAGSGPAAISINSPMALGAPLRTPYLRGWAWKRVCLGPSCGTCRRRRSIGFHIRGLIRR
jgi:hypothetical protein